MLVSLADMKTYLGIADVTYDDFLTSQLTTVSDAIEMYCRRNFQAADYVQTFYRFDHPRALKMYSYIYPIISVTSIIEDDVTTLDPADYIINKPHGIIINESYFFSAEKTVLTYRAGYETIPALLDQIVKEIVEERYNKKTNGISLNFGSDVQRISIPGTISVDFDYTLTNNDRSTPFGTLLGSHLNQLDYFRSNRSIVGTSKIAFNE